MKQFFLIFLLAQSVLLFSQNTLKNNNQKKTGIAQIQNMTPNLKHDTCLDKKFSVVFYLIDDTISTVLPVLTQSVAVLLDSMIMKMNQVFKPICVSFESCKVVVIPNHNYNRWRKDVTDTVVTQTWYTDQTINIYLPLLLENTNSLHPQHRFGYSFPPPSSPSTAKDVLVIQRNLVFTPNLAWVHPSLPILYRGANLMHTIGHFFGLRHTYDEINPQIPENPPPPSGVISYEFVDRTNCYLHGDGFCDTEADPTPSYIPGPAPFCYNTSNVKDGKGKNYIMPSDNFMSGTDCACRFTQEQYNYMAYIILTKRWYLH